MRTTVAAVLKEKGNNVWSLPPTGTVEDAIELMTQKRCQALLVLNDEKVVGVISERDCSRRVVLQGKSAAAVSVEEVMTSPVVCVSPKHTVGDCMWIMTEQRVTHLPVVEDEKVVGVIAIGDLLRTMVREHATTIDHLEGYISGKYPG